MQHETSSLNLMILKEIPTRDSLQDLPDAAVNLLNNPLDNDDAAHNTTTTLKQHPIKLDMAAPLPYELVLADLKAAIAYRQQHNNNTSPHQHHPTMQPFDS